MKKILILAPRHYVDELNTWYRSDAAAVEYFYAEHIEEDLPDFLGRAAAWTYDAYIGLTDYTAVVAAHLNAELSAPAPKSEAMVMSQDKYLSRRTQAGLGLYDGSYATENEVDRFTQASLPMFVKPRRASMSFLATRVDTPAMLRGACSAEHRRTLASKNARWATLYERLELDQEIRDGLNGFVIESLLPRGDQITIDGYAQDGKVGFFGITKSVFLPNGISFKRFDFPYQFPAELDEQIRRHAAAVVLGSALDNSLFNLEYKVDPREGTFALVEINTRTASQFLTPIQTVTGSNPLDVAIDIALANTVRAAPAEPAAKACSVLVFRRTDDAEIAKIPSQDEMRWLQETYPGSRWKSYALVGDRLSDHPNDSLSFRYAEVVVPHDGSVAIPVLEAEIQRRVTALFTFSP